MKELIFQQKAVQRLVDETIDLLRPVMYDELDQSDGVIRPGEILFVNWESINKEKNVMVRDSEQNDAVLKDLFGVSGSLLQELNQGIIQAHRDKEMRLEGVEGFAEFASA